MNPHAFLPKILQQKRISASSGCACKLIESEKSAKLKEVSITGISNDIILLSTDKIRGLENLLKKGNGLKQSDYLLLTEFKGKKRAVFFELKSTSFREDHFIEQFKGVECNCNYLDSIAARFHAATEKISEYTKHFVVFHKLPLTKGTTKLTRPPKNTDPSRALEYFVDNSHTVDLSEIVID